MSTPRNKIVIQGEPRGCFYEGILKTAGAKPGQCVAITGVTSSGGGADGDDNFYGSVYNEYHYAPGYAGVIAVLTEQNLVGKTEDDAYAVDDGVHVYFPQPGEDFRALGLSGQTLNVGSRAAFNAAGKLIAAAAGPIIVMEAGGTLSGDTLLICRYGGVTAATAS